MSGDDLLKYFPLFLAALSLLIAILGHFVKTADSRSQRETQSIDQIVKINSDLRAELERKQKALDEAETRTRIQAQAIQEKNDQLFDAIFKLHRIEINGKDKGV